MENTEKSFTIKTFGRRKGKALTHHQQWLVDNLLPLLTPNPDGVSLSEQPKIILEIGFGSGEHLMHLARENPDHIIIGAEPYINGVASLLSQITDNRTQGIIKPEYKNIRIWPDDVRKLLSVPCALCSDNCAMCSDFGFAKIYILHPDPWPKQAHEKRRLMQSEFLNELANYLAPGGQLIFGTDHTDLFDWTLKKVQNSKFKVKLNNEIIDLEKNELGTLNFELFTQPPESGLDTRYREKNKFGSDAPYYLVLCCG